MGLIIKSKPGQVGYIEEPAGIPATISSDLFKGYQSLIITTFSHGQSVNLQVSPAFRDAVYVYSFGDKPGQLSISGKALPTNPCKAQAAKKKNSRYAANAATSAASTSASSQEQGEKHTGLNELMKFYKENRHKAKKGLLTINLGDTPLRGLLQSVNVEETRDDNPLSLNFSLSLIMLPPKE